MDSLRRQRDWLERQLERQRRDGGDDPFDLIDRFATVFSRYRPSGLEQHAPRDPRLLARRDLLAQLIVGEPWSPRASESAANFREVWDATIKSPLGIPWNTSAREVARQQKFFTYKNLEYVVRRTGDGQLLAAQSAFAGPFYTVLSVIEKLEGDRQVSAAEKAQAEATYRQYSALFQIDPAWVTALFLYGVKSK